MLFEPSGAGFESALQAKLLGKGCVGAQPLELQLCICEVHVASPIASGVCVSCLGSVVGLCTPRAGCRC
jgi:hypothetical protein